MIRKSAMYFINRKIITNTILIKNATVNILTDSVVNAASVGLVVWCGVLLAFGLYGRVFCEKHISLVQWPKSAICKCEQQGGFSMYFPLYQKTNAIVISYDILLAPFISVFTLPQQKTCMLHMIINLAVFF